MVIDVRCEERFVDERVSGRCQLFAGHEDQHIAVGSVAGRRIMWMWSGSTTSVCPFEARYAASRAWAPGCPSADAVVRPVSAAFSPDLTSIEGSAEETSAPMGRLRAV
ncbi:MAG: hypothetical protein JO147_07365 [Actinobacteria bacterium]|nr:hypothetical protein [Actinomycetota bacterium]